MEDAMKCSPAFVLVVALLPAAVAGAQEVAFVDVPVQGRENVSYAYADVLRAIPTYEISRVVERVRQCDASVGSLPGSEAAPSDGAHGDSGQDASAVQAGVSAHSAAGGKDAEGCRTVLVEREERRINGYEVEYRYKGELYLSRMDVDPGNKLRIRVTVAPAD